MRREGQPRLFIVPWWERRWLHSPGKVSRKRKEVLTIQRQLKLRGREAGASDGKLVQAQHVCEGLMNCCCCFFFGHTTWYVGSSGIKPVLPAFEVWSLNHWTTREIPVEFFFFFFGLSLFKYLIIRLHWILVVSCGIFDHHWGMQDFLVQVHGI